MINLAADKDVLLVQKDGTSKPLNLEAGRRSFIKSLGLTVAGAAVFGSTTGFSPTEAQAQGITDADIFNFALNLEYLEAEFYLRAAFGRGLSDADVTGTGTLGGVSGGRLVPFVDTNIRNYAREIASDEEAHVKFIRAVVSDFLGSRQVARPTIDIGQAFKDAATAAGLSPTFDPYADDTSFLLGAFIFEDVGVTAYKGAAPLIQNKTLLEAAAGLLAVEAYHAGEIRTILYARGAFDPANRISALRGSLGGGKDQGIGDANVANIVPTEGRGLAFSRSPTEVLNIVYGNTTTRPGLFFPNGANGLIR